MSQFNQATTADFDESRQPTPAQVTGFDDVNDRTSAAHFEAQLLQPAGHHNAISGSPPLSRQLAITALTNCSSSGRGGAARQVGTRILDEGEHPAAPGAIGDYIREFIGIEVSQVCDGIVDAVLVTRSIERAKKAF